MQTAIQYAVADDGAPLAYALWGEGPTLIWLDVPWFSHLQREPAGNPLALLLERLSQELRIVRLDTRGSGASGRDARSFTTGQLARDVLAVADRAGIERFSVFARDAAGPVAIELASVAPERTERLILYASWLRGSDVGIHERMAAFEALIDVDWEMYTTALARVVMGVDDQTAKVVAAYFRECVDADVWRRATQAVHSFDITERAREVRCPTLVLYPDGGSLAPIELSQRLAASIPGARMTTLPGPQLPFGGTTAVVRAIADFMGVEAGARTAGVSTVQVILFTDIEGHSGMMTRLGDAGGRAVLREHERRTRAALAAYGGQEVKSLGDGFMAAFGSARRAIDCARALQRAFEEPAAGERLRIRAGINAGEPIAEDNDLFGKSVITASRITQEALGGQVLVSNVVRDLADGGPHTFRDAGLHPLKGIGGEPSRLWEVVLD